MKKRAGDKILEPIRSLVQEFCNWEQCSGKSLMPAVFAKLTQRSQSLESCAFAAAVCLG